MIQLENWLLAYLLNALWQVPLLFAVPWFAAHLLAREHPRVEHRLWTAALFAQLLLPALHLDPHLDSHLDLHWGFDALWLALRALLPWTSSGTYGSAHVGVVVGPTSVAGGALGVGTHLRTVLVAGYAAVLAYFALRFLWGLQRTCALRRRAMPLAMPVAVAQLWTERCRAAGIAPGAVALAHSDEVAGPVTIGALRPMLLLPTGFLGRVSADDLPTVFAHELAHVARYDFARNLCYGVAALPIAWHPGLWFTRRRLAESRELACDALAADATEGRRQYAHSLLRLASLLAVTPQPHAHAIGILDTHTFERRVMTLTRKLAPATTTRRLVTGAACCVLALVTSTFALALHATVSEATSPAPQDQSRPHSVQVKPEIMAGNKISGEVPVYPPEAKEKKIQGKVVLSAVILEEGTVEELKVVSSPDEILSKSALDAVRSWRYKPYSLNGAPVAVDTTINVTYSLGS